MSAPLVPSPLDYIGRRSFGFDPPIRTAGPNTWMLGGSGWSEVRIVNVETGMEVWVPRQYIGAVSDNQDALTVGLTQDVELRGEVVVPRSLRRVLMMPMPDAMRGARHQAGPASVVGIRLENKHRPAFHNAPFRVGICVLFVAGLLALVATASR